MFRSHLRMLIAFVALFSILAGCNQPISWGVVIWSPDETQVPSGALIAIRSSSQLNKTHTFSLDESNLELTTDQWRIESFKRKRDAETFAVLFSGWHDIYGVVRLDGLRVRTTADAAAVQLYKLRVDEAVKIITRAGEQVQVGSYRDYWYEVLTSEGVRGFVFGQYLELKSLSELSAVKPMEAADEFLERFFKTVYRPDHYREMVRTGRYDLNRFLPEYGIFADAEDRKIRIIREEHASTIAYDRISRPTSDSYAFEGSTLILTRRSENWINLIYADGGIRYSEDYVYFAEDIEAITNIELERRDRLYESMLEYGTELESSVYGTIRWQEDRTFTWEGYERLVPGVISPKVSGTGVVTFPLYLEGATAANYENAVVLEFASDDPLRPTESVAFLYTHVNDGIRFTFVPQNAIDANLIQSGRLSSIVIFFTVD